MRSVVTWSEIRTDPREGTHATVFDVCFSPDGSKLVAAVGNRVVVYDSVDGQVLHQLKGHKDTVYCVAYSRDGKWFASGGADKMVIIWTSKGEGSLKYTHGDTIQCLTYNPVTQQLISGTESDFGIWSREQKSVTKHKVPAKVNCAAWSSDGHRLALGLHSGTVSIRDREGKQLLQFERNAPVWCLSWSPDREHSDILAIGSWDGILAFFDSAGNQKWKDRELGFDPNSISYFPNGEYIVVGGSSGKAYLFTNEGIKLNVIIERPAWIWSAKVRPAGNYIGFGANDGSVGVCQIIFSTVHGLYADRYAFRDQMTNVIIQNLTSDVSMTLKLRDYVKKIAIYKDRLAVSVPDRVIIYELVGEGEYVPKQQLKQTVECNLLVVTTHHLVLCLEKRLQMLDFHGNKIRDWVLDAVIRYIKVCGGPSGRETLLVGLKNGAVYKVVLDNPFPVLLVNIGLSIRCLDLSKSRKMLAVVDENSDCSVYNLESKEMLFKEPNANSVAWNSEMEHMLCFSGNGTLSIKTSNFPAAVQKLSGFVVGFRGSKIFCLQYLSMQTIDVPQSASMYRFIQVKDFENAYRTACLGVTDSDWRVLAMESLANMNFSVARRAFIRNRDTRYIELLNQIEAEKKAGGDTQVFLADIYAYQGRFQDAARIYVKCGQVKKAIDMFSVLRQYKEAQEFAKQSGVNVQDLLLSQAEWLEEVGELVAAAQMYSAAGEFARAIKMLADRRQTEEIMELARGLAKTDTKNLRMCIDYLTREQKMQYAEELIRKIGEEKLLLSLYVQMRRWEDAFRLVESNPSLDATEIHLPYAYWLAENDRFDEAQAAFARAGVPEKALELLESLTRNSVIENRYTDAAHYYTVLALEYLKLIKPAAQANAAAAANAKAVRLTLTDEQNLAKFRQAYARGEAYYAYAFIHRYATQPFTSTPLETLFHISHFLVNRIISGGSQTTVTFPLGVSRIHCLNALAKSSTAVSAFKLARTAYSRLHTLRFPGSMTDAVDLATMTIRAKPCSDAAEMVPSCVRCDTSISLLGGELCGSCGQQIVRSWGAFEQLPLVEFVPEDGISDTMALRYIEMDDTRSLGGNGKRGGQREWKETKSGSTNVMRMDDDDNENDAGGYERVDLFAELLAKYETTGEMTKGPVVCSKDVLISMPSNEVFVKKWPTPGMRYQYYRNLIPDISVILCVTCFHFFNTLDLEGATLQKNQCPICRGKLT